MRQTFEVQNVKCEGCATTLKKKLAPEFGEVEVDLSSFPRKITLDIEKGQLEALVQTLRSLGYPLATEELGTMENAEAKLKSFVSCAVGKFDTQKP